MKKRVFILRRWKLYNVPTTVFIPWRKSRKKIILNLNWFRNAHYLEINRAKQEFNEEMDRRYPSPVPFDGGFPLKIVHHYYHHSKREVDTNNPISVIDKFFQDWLVTRKVIPDDNYKFVELTIFWFRGIEKMEVPRCLTELFPSSSSYTVGGAK